MRLAPAETIPALLRLGALPPHRWDAALEEVLRVDSALLDVDRVSYWTLQDDPTSIVCELGYVHSKHLFERGAVILEREAADYLSQVRCVQVLALADVASDPRVGPLSGYFEAHGIGAILDLPVFAGGKLVGVLCHEHVGGARRWTAHETELALSMCKTVSALLEARARSDAEEAESRSAFLARTANVLAGTLDLARARELAIHEAIPVLAEMCTILGYDGTRAWRVAQAHQDPRELPLLEELTGRYGADIGGPGIGVQALRERQSLLIRTCDPVTLREYGLDEGHIELLGRLRVRSVLAVLLRARNEITGCLTLASTTRSYTRSDIDFAEAYARQVGILLSNVELYVRAREAVQARDEFLSLAAHELRTPLTSLALASAQLGTEIPSDASARLRRAVDVVQRQTKRLVRLSELVLAAARSRGFEGPKVVETIDLGGLVRDVVGELADALARAGCEPRIEGGAPVFVEGDRAQLAVVLTNLLDNAMKFGAGHPIEISARATDAGAVLVVRDCGIGLSEEQHARLFRRFERGVSWKHFGGLGLGLHVSSRIVGAHGGSIRAESRGGRGATFVVELPRTPPSAERAPAVSEP